ncbi:MAG: cob(I)yrinic acid a,c-diamide adenosyltransferase [Planctomycetes bacterium]|nr:cob(I)yrinic acid a,c-diamide adenosyltransferase [Planctomycetota bacterium]
MKIYTRTGDSGSTGLFGGARVSKFNPRIEAYGSVDELNAVLGMARAAGLPAELDAELAAIQEDLFVVGAYLADPSPEGEKKMRISIDRVRALERWIDGMEAVLPALRNFILPGGSPGGAALHLARTVCRRAERATVALHEKEAVAEPVVYLNRLADALFVAARYANFRAGVAETLWKAGK